MRKCCVVLRNVQGMKPFRIGFSVACSLLFWESLENILVDVDGGGDLLKLSASPGHCRFWQRVRTVSRCGASLDWFLLRLVQLKMTGSCLVPGLGVSFANTRPEASSFNQIQAPTC